jgi:hypothetical protein
MQGRLRLLESRVEALENELLVLDMSLEAMRLRGCSSSEIGAQMRKIAPGIYQNYLNMLEREKSYVKEDDYD